MPQPLFIPLFKPFVPPLPPAPPIPLCRRYGMHFGWAIEGAIGSPLKIDASYLSPHVNTAARLEAATKQFQTMFLLSDEFVKQLSPRNQRLCRRIDCVVRPRVRLVSF